jgi:hypothetical protein
MNKQQAQDYIAEVLQNPFDREKYINFISNLLNHIERRDKRYSGGEVPEAYRGHINQYWRVGKYISPDDVEIDILIVEVKSLSKLDRAHYFKKFRHQSAQAIRKRLLADRFLFQRRPGR